MKPQIRASARWTRIALALLCLAVFIFLAMQVVLRGPLTQWDLAVSRWFAQHRTPGLTQLMRAMSAMHQTVAVLIATALIAGWRAVRRDWATPRALLVVPVGMLLNVALKDSFQRPRPSLDDPLVQLMTYSFPSGHALAATVFYGMLFVLVQAHVRSRPLRLLAAVVGVVMVLLVTLSRVVLGAHYPSDVIAGVAEGTLCVLLFLPLARRPRPHPSSSG